MYMIAQQMNSIMIAMIIMTIFIISELLIIIAIIIITSYQGHFPLQLSSPAQIWFPDLSKL